MKLFLVILLFCGITFVFFFPVILNFNTHIAGFYSTDEPFGVIWSFWWLKHAFLNKISVNFINVIAYPFGIVTNSVAFFPLWSSIVKYIAIFSNEIFAYNTVLLSTFVTAGITMYFLSFYLTRNYLVSIFAGLIYSFCPFHIVRVWQHFGTAQIQWLPLYFLIFFLLFNSKSKKHGFWLGFVFALNYYFDTHYGYFLALVSIPLALYMVFNIKTKKERVEFIKSLSLAALVGMILIIPAIIPFLKDIVRSRHQLPSPYSFVRPFEDLFAQSARPLSYLLPFTEQPLLGNFTLMFVGTDFWGRSLTEQNIFLGFIPMALAVISIIKKNQIVGIMKRKGLDVSLILKFCFLLFFVSWLYSQPPWWNFFGIKVYMPSYFLYKTFPMFRAYVRFGIVTMLAVSLLGSFGLIFILEKVKLPVNKFILFLLICSLSLFEFWSNPVKHNINLSEYPKVYDWLKKQQGDIVIAEYPLDIIGPGERYKFYQTKHGKKIINGTIPGTFAHKVSEGLTELSSERNPPILKWMGVKFVFVHVNDYKNTEIFENTEEISKIKQSKGLNFVNSFDDIDVYEVTAQPKKPEITGG